MSTDDDKINEIQEEKTSDQDNIDEDGDNDMANSNSEENTIQTDDSIDSSAWKVKKRDGSISNFSKDNIRDVISKAVEAVGGSDFKEAKRLASEVFKEIDNNDEYNALELYVEEIQDIVEKVLIKEGHVKTAKAYILYREKHRVERELKQLQELKIDPVKLDDDVSKQIADMFKHKSKLSKLIEEGLINDYKVLLLQLRRFQKSGELPVHPECDYLNGSDLAANIYDRKYFLKNLEGEPIEKRPEDLFCRVASFIAAVEPTEKKQLAWAKAFYDALYEGYFLPGGRVLAGAGDMYRLKTLANCFVSVIDADNIESIYKAAYEAARTYSYGGGIGIDLSVLRPKDSVVHNAADHSTGAVSFMELYSMTTGLIGQSGRRGALMLTLDVKHPDVFSFIQAKKTPNWITNQVVEQCKWGDIFTQKQLEEVEKQVMENTQVRFANISLKVTDEFMSAVDEQKKYNNNAILLYKKDKDVDNGPKQQGPDKEHYSYGIPSKPIESYEFLGEFDSFDKLNKTLKEEYGHLEALQKDQLDNVYSRDVYGDHVIRSADCDFAIRRAGDFMLYYNSPQVGEIKKLVKARDIWNKFVEGNYSTAEPGLIFWSRMSKYSPSDYVGRRISSTNPCGEVPLEGGGACNLASLNLSRFVKDGYTEKAEIDFENLAEKVRLVIRFLDNVISWNEKVFALNQQSEAAKQTRRLGLGVMGIADMLNKLGLGYDSDEGKAVIENVMSFISDKSYEASAILADEKGQSPIFDYDKYSRSPFFNESISQNTRDLIQQNGLRNIAMLSIAPTGTISNIILSHKNGNHNYIGVSGGVEPIFALYYTRRSESFGNKLFKVFHSTVQAYLDMKGIKEEAEKADEGYLKKVLPDHFFRTAHTILPENRVRIQSICQTYIDQSISSTVNLAEDISPETISNIYLDAWKNNLKGITIYREGSRYPILKAEAKSNDFQKYKNKTFRLTAPDGTKIEAHGDKVITLPDGSLTTVFHMIKEQQKSKSNEETLGKKNDADVKTENQNKVNAQSDDNQSDDNQSDDNQSDDNQSDDNQSDDNQSDDN